MKRLMDGIGEAIVRGKFRFAYDPEKNRIYYMINGSVNYSDFGDTDRALLCKVADEERGGIYYFKDDISLSDAIPIPDGPGTLEFF